MPRSNAQKRQGRLAFTPLPSSSPASKGYNQQIRDRAAIVSLDSSPHPTKRRKLLSSSENTASPSIQRIGNVAMPTPNASLNREEAEIVDDTDSEQTHSTPHRLSSGPVRSSKARKAQQRIDFSRSRDPSSFDSPVRLSSSTRPSSSKAGIFNTAGQTRIVEDDSSENSDSDAQLPSPVKLMAKSRRNRTSESVVALDESESDEIVLERRDPARNPAKRRTSDDDGDEDDEDMPTTLGKRKHRQRNSSPDRSDSLSPPHAIDSDDDVIIVENSRQKRAAHRTKVTSDDEEEDDNEPITPRRRKLKRKRQFTEQEKNDLDEDLDFLGPSSDVESTARTPRTTQSSQKSARLKALEALKRRRNGNLEKVEERSEEDDDAGGNEVDGAEQNDDNEISEDDDEIQIMSSRQMFQAEEEDANFLTDEGEDAPLGVPDRLPIEFTKYASMKPKELFKYAVDWMVQRKINPAFEGDDELYDLSFKKLDDEVRALAGSKFTSSAWTPQFTLALQARPDIAYESIDRTSAEHFFRDKCDACNRGSHPATFQIQFIGNPYYHRTLEEVGDDEEDDDASSSTDSDSAHKDDKPAYDEQGREIPPASATFYVGKFCMANAHTAHSLRHWRYHLNEWVITWLIKEGYCTPEKVVERDGWKKRKRGKYAHKIVDRMVQKGTVKELWRSFRDNIDQARNSKQGRYGDSSP